MGSNGPPMRPMRSIMERILCEPVASILRIEATENAKGRAIARRQPVQGRAIARPSGLELDEAFENGPLVVAGLEACLVDDLSVADEDDALRGAGDGGIVCDDDDRLPRFVE